MSFYKKISIYFAALLIIFCIAVMSYQYRRDRQNRIDSLNLMQQTQAQFIHNYLSSHHDSIAHMTDLARMLHDQGTRLTIIGTDGTVLFDNLLGDLSETDDHADRPEIAMARTSPFGYDIRRSATLGTNCYYFAQRFDHYFIRSSIAYDTELAGMLHGDYGYIYFMAVLFVAMMAATLYMMRKTSRTIVRLRDFAQQTQNGDGPDPSTTFPDDEFGEIGTLIAQNYRQLRRTQRALAREKEKLLGHLQTTHEGLAIFGNRGEQILANTLFTQYADIIDDTTNGQPDRILQAPQFAPVDSYLQKPDTDGCNFNISKDGRIFAVRCFRFSDGSFEISITENTQQFHEQEMKRQLTQNISHELKTPVSSIRGYLETIIETPAIADDTRLKFIRRAYDQTQRLANLIQDISLLNKIDNRHPMFGHEAICVRELIEGVRTDLALLLEQRRMAMHIEVDADLTITGDATLIYSIFRNLTDNAIAYAGEDTEIIVRCYRTDPKTAYFSFRDTGLGVPPQHIDRIFERFYRVDEGRSRATGGTGLGLAIVKNAILMHHGTITARNNPHGGLELLFSLAR